MARNTHDIRNDHFALSISPAQLTANTDNWNPTGLSTAAIIRASTDASRNLTGIVAPSSAVFLWLLNVGSQDLVIKHDVTSTAANRFYCPDATDLTLPPDGAIQIFYDTTSSRWRVIGGMGGGSGATPTLDEVLLEGNDTGGLAFVSNDTGYITPTEVGVGHDVAIQGHYGPVGEDGGYIDLSAGFGDYDPGGPTFAAAAGLFLDAGHGDGFGGEAYLYTGDAEVGTDADAGDITLDTGAGDGTGRDGLIIIPNLPTSDPGVSGALWVDGSGFIKRSA